MFFLLVVSGWSWFVGVFCLLFIGVVFLCSYCGCWFPCCFGFGWWGWFHWWGLGLLFSSIFLKSFGLIGNFLGGLWFMVFWGLFVGVFLVGFGWFTLLAWIHE